LTAAIDIQGVVKRYGAFEALRGVSLRVEPGEFFGLLGPNGAGKTTLISIVAGLARASAGQVRVMGHDVVTDFRRARAALGVVPQELVFDPFFTVRETLRITSGYYGIRRNDDWIDEILAELDLTAKADANMRALSGGMKRRVLVAQALVHRPPVIVLDEPTAGVDVELRQTLWRFVRRLNADGHTIVLTTHYLEEAQELCGRIAMLKQGQVVALERTAALLGRFSGGRLLLRLARGTLPEALAPLLIGGVEPGGAPARLQLRVDRYEQVEPILAALREGGCAVEEMELQHTDLEDVFVRIMREAR
jgi:ABC-2 type transport system ATP-binding protein